MKRLAFILILCISCTQQVKNWDYIALDGDPPADNEYLCYHLDITEKGDNIYISARLNPKSFEHTDNIVFALTLTSPSEEIYKQTLHLPLDIRSNDRITVKKGKRGSLIDIEWLYASQLESFEGGRWKIELLPRIEATSSIYGLGVCVR